LAAVLLASGVAPGPILVFLLVGPATNVASIAMLKRVLGGWATARYVLVVVLTAIVAGVVADWAWGAVGATVRMSGGMEHGEQYGVVSVASAVFLSALILYYTGRKYWRSLTRRFKWQERPNAA
jgi:hypothetical protein